MGARMLASGLLLAAASVNAQHTPGQFPPGWNKVALTPPMGWRSWNAWGNRVSQQNMEASIDALVAKLWTVDGKQNTSLFEAGYTTAGIDEGWEGCGKGVNGTQHAANGDPVINPKFPDMAGLVKYGHTAGLEMGWYENGCACGERHALEINYEGDVRQLHALDFDGVKLDGCGAQRNMTLYASLMKATGKSYLIENCHWGKCSADDGSSCPTKDWCPFNWYRTSGDINSSPMSWYSNLQTTIQFQDPTEPLSVPGCWAYPDMLEVGRIKVDGKMNYGWNRAHFGAWCVVSAPLILGMDVTKQEILEPVVDVITNKEAIAVNQAWAGHPGALVWSGQGGALGYPAAKKCDPSNSALKQKGWALKPLKANASEVALTAPGGGCLTQSGAGFQGGAGGLVIAECNGTDPSQTFTYNPTTFELVQVSSKHCVDVHSGGPIVWMYGCTSGPNDQLKFDKTAGTITANKLCFGVEADDPAGKSFQSTLQAWAKPLNATEGVALLMINPDTKPHTFSVPIAKLPTPPGAEQWTIANGEEEEGDAHHAEEKSRKAMSVRDIWARKDLAPLAAGATDVTMTVGPMDSAFLRLY